MARRSGRGEYAKLIEEFEEIRSDLVRNRK
jgi:hypothetical protein